MAKVIPDSPEDRKHRILAALVNPEVLFWIGLALFGTAAAGWFLIGAGALLALLPPVDGLVWWLIKKRTTSEA